MNKLTYKLQRKQTAKKNYGYIRGRKTAARRQNATLKAKICGPRGTFQPKKNTFLKTYKKCFAIKIKIKLITSYLLLISVILQLICNISVQDGIFLLITMIVFKKCGREQLFWNMVRELQKADDPWDTFPVVPKLLYKLSFILLYQVFSCFTVSFFKYILLNNFKN